MSARALASAAIALAACLAGCDDRPLPIDPGFPPEDPIPAPTSPENLVRAIEALYNDKLRSAEERLNEYQNLFTEDFIYCLTDPQVGRECWGLADEIKDHRCLFEAQENREIFSLELVVANEPARDLDPPEEGREGWKEVFAKSVFLRLLTSPEDGFEVQGGQARFLCAPAGDGSRWFIAEWLEMLPGGAAPAAGGGRLEPTTWASLKGRYCELWPQEP